MRCYHQLMSEQSLWIGDTDKQIDVCLAVHSLFDDV